MELMATLHVRRRADKGLNPILSALEIKNLLLSTVDKNPPSRPNHHRRQITHALTSSKPDWKLS